MGALNEGHFNDEIEKGVHFLCHGSDNQLGFEAEPETIAIKEAVKVLLHGLSEDVNREGIRKTPLRVAKALREGTSGYKKNVMDIVKGALFPEAGVDSAVGRAGGVGGVVVVRDLDHFSYCESCLLPFQVKLHVGYVPSGQRVVGLSKLSRVADVFAKRLQEPSRLARELSSALHRSFGPAGVAVLLQCRHLHLHRGWVETTASSGSGVFDRDGSSAWVDFLGLVRLDGAAAAAGNAAGDHPWCPSRQGSEPADVYMTAAVTSILRSIGEDPSREGLAGTPARFVNWLTKFRNEDAEMRLSGPPEEVGPTVSGEEERRRVQSELGLPFWSQCEHHLLPFHGVVHIGFMGDKRLDDLGRARLQTVVHSYGFRLQVQERLTRQIAEAVSPYLGSDVIVVGEASHTCMVSRGIEKFGSSTATVAVLGQFSTDSSLRALFLRGISSATEE